jgi:CheY-like chemotaxis protein/Tfp pilus assembly protein PilZ
MSVKVLIVDDVSSVLDLETSFLSRTDCSVFKATNGLEALRIAKSEKPDIIFLDLEMPVMNGIECCRFIRTDIDLKETPVVIVTASSKEEECYRVGCSSYLRKPIDEDIFLTEIKKFIPIQVRNDPRLEVSIPASVTFKGTKTTGTVCNISRSGLFLESGEPFGIGSKVTVDFSLPDRKEKVKTKAMVVRLASEKSSDSKGFGLSFFEIAEKNQALIDSFIESQT